MKSVYVRRYNRRGGKGTLSDKEMSMVEALVQRRSEELSRFNRQAADSIRKGLRNKYFVVIDDINGEWHIRGNDYILAPECESSLPKEVGAARGEIEKLIRERSQAKGEGDFNRADEIRTDLMESFGVQLNDRVKEWNIVSRNSDSSKEPGRDKNLSKEHKKNAQIRLRPPSGDTVVASSLDEVTAIQESGKVLSKLTVVELKEKLRMYGLPVSGKKTVLIQRILDRDS